MAKLVIVERVNMNKIYSLSQTAKDGKINYETLKRRLQLDAKKPAGKRRYPGVFKTGRAWLVPADDYKTIIKEG
jgi:hypothetical protein